MALITIQDTVCWKCGKPFDGGEGMGKTMHHGLPQHLNPVNNIIVPIHEKCHDLVNENDIVGMKSFAAKINIQLNDLTKQVGKLNKNVEAMDKLDIGDILKKGKK